MSDDQSPAGERLLAQRVRELREARGWTQAELAQRVGVHQTAVSRIEKPSGRDGRRTISLDEALAFSRAFEVSLERLLSPVLDPSSIDSVVDRIATLTSEFAELRDAEDRAKVMQQAAAVQMDRASQHLSEVRRKLREISGGLREEERALRVAIRRDEAVRTFVRSQYPEVYDQVGFGSEAPDATD